MKRFRLMCRVLFAGLFAFAFVTALWALSCYDEGDSWNAHAVVSKDQSSWSDGPVYAVTGHLVYFEARSNGGLASEDDYDTWQHQPMDDPDKLSYSWDYGPGAYDISTSYNNRKAQCKYNTAGDKTVTLTVTDVGAPNYYDEGPKTDTVEVRVIDDLTVFPRAAYVAVNKSKAFSAWTVQEGSAADVTGDSTFSSSRGSCTDNTFNAPSTPSGSVGSDWVRATYQEETTDSAHDSDVTVFEVEITTPAPANFPVYVTVNEQLQLDSTVTPGSIAGGDFEWSQDSGPADKGTFSNKEIKNPAFSSDTPGTYTVKVEYTKDGSAASDTSGNIVVFNVEIDTPASFPACVSLSGSLQLGCTVTPGAAAGGTFTWSKVSGPGNVTFTPNTNAQNPTFSADAPGTYTVKVEYTKDGSTASDTSGNLVVFDVEITTPTTTAMNITSASAMPNVTFHADIEPESVLSNATFKWYLNMAFTHDSLGELTHRVPASGTDNVGGNENWTPNWGALLAGGDVQVYVKVSVSGSSEGEDDQDGYQIKGSNPTQNQIFQIADLRARSVCWKESTHRQFDAIRYTGIGPPLPSYAHDGGYGLMQITPSSEAQTWNWTTNLNSGISHLNTEYNRSVQHVSNINTPGIAPDPDPTPDPELTMTTDQHWMNAFSRYRAGTYYYGYELVSGTEYQWVRLSGTGPDYADDIVDIMENKPWE